MSMTRKLVELILDKPVTDDALNAAAMSTLDAVATAYAGSVTPVGKVLRNWAADAGPDSKRRALLMGSLSHITETDDLHRASVTHPGCVVVPTALALGEQIDAKPEKILRAILHGFEAMCRIGAAVGPTHYKVWHNTATCGPYGSAMAAATLLDLDVEQTVNALGNAGTQSSGFWQFMETGAMSKHLHAGRAAESGWLASELAAHGFTGSPEIIEGQKGMFAGMCADPNPDAILANPESIWQLELTSIKPWPSCRHTHPAIDCALQLHKKLPDTPIKQVDVDTYQAALDVCDRPEPTSEYQAKFSLYHCVAIALLEGEVTLTSFDEVAREKTRVLCDATTVSVVDPFASAYPRSWGSGVRVVTTRGENFYAEQKDCKGDPELPLGDAEMRIKALNLMGYAGVETARSEQLCDDVLTLSSSRNSPRIFSDFLQHIAVN